MRCNKVLNWQSPSGTTRHEVKTFNVDGTFLSNYEPYSSFLHHNRSSPISSTAFHPHRTLLACSALHDNHINLVSCWSIYTFSLQLRSFFFLSCCLIFFPLQPGARDFACFLIFVYYQSYSRPMVAFFFFLFLGWYSLADGYRVCMTGLFFSLTPLLILVNLC